jgi:hypothetical protein
VKKLTVTSHQGRRIDSIGRRVGIEARDTHGEPSLGESPLLGPSNGHQTPQEVDSTKAQAGFRGECEKGKDSSACVHDSELEDAVS